MFMYKVNKKYRGTEGPTQIKPFLVFITWTDEDGFERASATHVAAPDSYEALLVTQEYHDTNDEEVSFHYVQEMEYFQKAEHEIYAEEHGPCVFVEETSVSVCKSEDLDEL